MGCDIWRPRGGRPPAYAHTVLSHGTAHWVCEGCGRTLRRRLYLEYHPAARERDPWSYQSVVAQNRHHSRACPSCGGRVRLDAAQPPSRSAMRTHGVALCRSRESSYDAAEQALLDTAAPGNNRWMALVRLRGFDVMAAGSTDAALKSLALGDDDG